MKIFGKLSSTILTSSSDFVSPGLTSRCRLPMVVWWREEDSNLRSRTTTDLQSVPFGRSGIPPGRTVLNPFSNLNVFAGAGDGTRTRNLLITSQLLYQLSYASTCFFHRENRICLFIETRRQSQE